MFFLLAMRTGCGQADFSRSGQLSKNLHLLDDRVQQRTELTLDSVRRFRHFRMVQRLIQNARRHVRDAADAQHARAAVPRNDDLRNRAHADRVCAQHAKHANLRRRFIGRSGHLRIDALAQDKALLLRAIMRQR